MATQVLDLILKSPLGKQIFTWFLIVLVAMVAALGWYSFYLSEEIKALNLARINDQKAFNLEKEKSIREQITIYQAMVLRLQAVEQKKKSRK